MTNGKHAAVIYGTHFPNKLFLGCLPAKATADHVSDLFSKYGKVIEAKVVLDDRGNSRRFGFVTFSRLEEADTVLKENSIWLLGKQINVGPAVRKEEKDFVPTTPVRIVTSTAVNIVNVTTPSKAKYKFTFPATISSKPSASSTLSYTCITKPIPSSMVTPSIVQSSYHNLCSKMASLSSNFQHGTSLNVNNTPPAAPTVFQHLNNNQSLAPTTLSQYQHEFNVANSMHQQLYNSNSTQQVFPIHSHQQLIQEKQFHNAYESSYNPINCYPLQSNYAPSQQNHASPQQRYAFPQIQYFPPTNPQYVNIPNMPTQQIMYFTPCY